MDQEMREQFNVIKHSRSDMAWLAQDLFVFMLTKTHSTELVKLDRHQVFMLQASLTASSDKIKAALEDAIKESRLFNEKGELYARD